MQCFLIQTVQTPDQTQNVQNTLELKCPSVLFHTEENFTAIYHIQNTPTEPCRLQVTPSQSSFPGVHTGVLY